MLRFIALSFVEVVKIRPVSSPCPPVSPTERGSFECAESDGCSTPTLCSGGGGSGGSGSGVGGSSSCGGGGSGSSGGSGDGSSGGGGGGGGGGVRSHSTVVAQIQLAPPRPLRRRDKAARRPAPWHQASLAWLAHPHKDILPSHNNQFGPSPTALK